MIVLSSNTLDINDNSDQPPLRRAAAASLDIMLFIFMVMGLNLKK
jgi:hypothetical protein